SCFGILRTSGHRSEWLFGGWWHFWWHFGNAVEALDRFVQLAGRQGVPFSHPGRAVAEEVANVLDVDARHAEPRGERVPEVLPAGQAHTFGPGYSRLYGAGRRELDGADRGVYAFRALRGKSDKGAEQDPI